MAKLCPFQISVNSVTGMVDASHISNAPLAQLEEDPSLAVRYAAPHDPGAVWVEAGLDHLLDAAREPRALFICFLGPATNEGGLSLYLATKSDAGPQAGEISYLQANVRTLAEIKRVLRRLGIDRTILCLPRPEAGGISDVAALVLDEFGKCARVVCWDPVGRAASLHGTTNVFYLEASYLSRQARLPPAVHRFAPSPVGLIQLDRVGDSCLPIVSCVPTYWMQIVTSDAIKAYVKPRTVRRIRDSWETYSIKLEEDYDDNQLSALIDAITVYEFIYRPERQGPIIPTGPESLLSDVLLLRRRRNA